MRRISRIDGDTVQPDGLSGVIFQSYRKLPVVILAAQMDEAFEVETLEGVMRGNSGDWLICGVNGELYPCKPDIFAKTYELAEEGG